MPYKAHSPKYQHFNGLQSTRTEGQLVPSQLVPKLSRTHGQLVPKYKRNAKKCCNLRKVADVNEKCHLQCHGNSQI